MLQCTEIFATIFWLYLLIIFTRIFINYLLTAIANGPNVAANKTGKF